MKRLILSTLAVSLFIGSLEVIAQTNAVTVSIADETLNRLSAGAEDRWFRRDVILGGILAAIAGIAAGLIVHWIQVRQQSIAEAASCSNILRAIRWELEALKRQTTRTLERTLKRRPRGTISRLSSPSVRTGSLFSRRTRLTWDG